MNFLTIPNEFDGVSVRAVIEVPKGSQVRTEVQNIPNEFRTSSLYSLQIMALSHLLLMVIVLIVM